MSYAIDIPPVVFDAMQELPRRTLLSIHLMLSRLAKVALLWPPADVRWEHFGRRDGEGLCFYVEGCCVRVEVRSVSRLIAVREIGRVLVRLPPQVPDCELEVQGSAAQH